MPPPLEARDYIGLGDPSASSSRSSSSSAAGEVGPHLALRLGLLGSESPGRAEAAVDAALTLSPAPPRGAAKRGFADSLDRSTIRDAAAAGGVREEDKGMGEATAGAPPAAKVNDASDSAETAVFQNGMYISVIGSLKGLQERKRATAFSIRPVTDFNEVTLHFIQCVQLHLENTKSKVSGPAQTSSFSNGFSESSTPTSSKSNPAPVNRGTNGSETDLYTQVLNVFREPAIVESEHGVHIDELAKRLRLPASNIKEAIEYHVDVGHIYSTIDDFHFKSAFID